MITGLGSAIVVVAQARLLSSAIAGVFLEGQNLADLRGTLAELLGVIVLRALLAFGGEIAAHQVAARVKSDLREALFAHLFQLGPAYARGARTGELSALLMEGVEALDAYFSQFLPQVALAALIPLTILFSVFPLDSLSAVVLLLTAPLIPIFMVLIGKLGQLATRRQWTALSRLSGHFLDAIQGLTTLNMFGRAHDQAKALAESGERYRLATMAVLRVTFLSALTLELIATLSTAIVAVEIGLRLLNGGILYPQALMILILAPEFYLPL
ncbi:MAG TPA: ABC transporter transmembrane domain-containing protein, partial [Anaerolineaceae bacterium]|nr:ABC transporter transmembrane domain-containing protein [Anaerolineaceae bacterium]